MRFSTARSLALATLFPTLVLFALVTGCAKQSEGERCGDSLGAGASDDCGDNLVCKQIGPQGENRCCYSDGHITDPRCEVSTTTPKPNGGASSGGSGATAGGGGSSAVGGQLTEAAGEAN